MQNRGNLISTNSEKSLCNGRLSAHWVRLCKQKRICEFLWAASHIPAEPSADGQMSTRWCFQLLTKAHHGSGWYGWTGRQVPSLSGCVLVRADRGKWTRLKSDSYFCCGIRSRYDVTQGQHFSFLPSEAWVLKCLCGGNRTQELWQPCVSSDCCCSAQRGQTVYTSRHQTVKLMLQEKSICSKMQLLAFTKGTQNQLDSSFNCFTLPNEASLSILEIPPVS